MVVQSAAMYIMSHYVALVIDGLFIFISVLVFCFRPCKSLIMNLSLGYHFVLFGLIFINIALWEADLSFSTEQY